MRQPYALAVKVKPTADPIELGEAKAHLKIDKSITEENDLIANLIKTAVGTSETICNRALMKQTWTLYLDEFPCGLIEMPKAPLRAVNSVKYLDPAGVQQTLAASEYTVDVKSEPGRMRPAYGKSWPATRCDLNAVEIEFECGYANAAEVPFEIRAAMLLLIGHLYEHRESVVLGVTPSEVPHGSRELLWPHRILNA